MDTVNLPAIQNTVLWATFALAFVFGAVANRTHFCTMGAVSDIVNMGDWARMRMWLLAIAVAILGTNGLALMGIIKLSNSIYTTPNFTWLSYIVGGLLFGFGMVLASGCGSKTLVRIGAGNLKSLVVFVVLGLVAYMTMRGILGVARVNTLDKVAVTLGSTQDLPSVLASLFGASKATLQAGCSAVIGLGLMIFCLKDKNFRTIDNLLGGFVIGLVIVGVWYVSGKLGYVAEHPDTLQEAFIATNSGRMESLTFVAPFAYTLDWLILFSDKSKVLTVAIVAVFGVVAGSLAYSVVSKTFRWEGFGGAEDTANHLVGAALMGAGGVLALGCTVGQGLSGVSTLALGSMVTTAAIVAGGIVGIKYQIWRVG